MSKETLVFIGGIILTILPFLGIPETWGRTIAIALGVILIFIGYALRRAKYLAQIDQGNGERRNDSFVETTQPLFDDRTVQ